MELGKEMLYLTDREVASLGITMEEIVDLLEATFVEKSHGRYEMPPKIGVHTQPNDFIHAMPSWIPALDSVGIKWVSGYTKNAGKGLPYITGVLVLNCTKTGVPIAIMNCSWISSMRTGGVTGLAARHLANKDSKTVAVISNGLHARRNLQGIMAVCKDIKKVYAYDINIDASHRYVEDMKKEFDVEYIVVTDPKDAIVDADIITSSGPFILDRDISFIEKDWLKSGVTCLPIDNDIFYTKPAIQEGIDKFYTDDSGQFQKFLEDKAVLRINKTPAELCDVITGKTEGRKNAQERIFSCNIGMSLDDITVAAEVYKRAVEKKIGTILEL